MLTITLLLLIIIITKKTTQTLDSTGYSTLPLPPMLMRRTYTQRDGR